jgi:hypothetical protein
VEDYPGGGDRHHAPVTLYAVVTFTHKGKQQDILVPTITGQKYEFEEECTYNNYTAPEWGANFNADGTCKDCGEKDSDIYHHHIYCQPKKEATQQKVPTKTIEVWEKQHAKDCRDPYHCDCPQHKIEKIVPKEKTYVKVHKEDCVDKYHCDCPEAIEYR